MESSLDLSLSPLAETLVTLCRTQGVRLATAESCTGGMIGATLTTLAGVSDVFEGGILAYQNRIKQRLLEVNEDLLKREGAVSEACARAMAQGAQKALQTEVAIAVTGIAGPSGGSPEKPVGLVYIAVAINTQVCVEKHTFKGDRHAVRLQTVARALTCASDFLKKVSQNNG